MYKAIINFINFKISKYQYINMSILLFKMSKRVLYFKDNINFCAS